MRRATATLRLVTLESAAALGCSGAHTASAAGSSSSLLASLRSAARKAGLTSARQCGAAAPQAATSAAASCSGIAPEAMAAAALLSAARRGLHAAAARSHSQASTPLLAGVPRSVRLSTRAGLAADAAEAAAAAVPVSWAARGHRMRTRAAAARRQLACRMEWVLGRGYHAREAFFNAIYMQASRGGRWWRWAATGSGGLLESGSCSPARAVPSVQPSGPPRGLQPRPAPILSLPPGCSPTGASHSCCCLPSG